MLASDVILRHEHKNRAFALSGYKRQQVEGVKINRAIESPVDEEPGDDQRLPLRSLRCGLLSNRFLQNRIASS